MARTYVTVDGDMIDRICWRAYDGRQAGAVEAVLEANRVPLELSGYPAVLPRGLKLILPDLPRETREVAIQPLWD
jgi:phage tail protein X